MRDFGSANPVKRGSVVRPEQWRWSSFCSYLYGEKGLVRVNYQESPSRITPHPAQKFGDPVGSNRYPFIRTERE